MSERQKNGGDSQNIPAASSPNAGLRLNCLRRMRLFTSWG